ncbi:unnamed protein product [Haemonchus placei]|uniref:Secreted protein n=1 Tax=Haemonchus placei TaxID=6290 RepID=A0A0N4WUM3_HAEPC|nr:unnamed protein product [Haemonchus placei]
MFITPISTFIQSFILLLYIFLDLLQLPSSHAASNHDPFPRDSILNRSTLQHPPVVTVRSLYQHLDNSTDPAPTVLLIHHCKHFIFKNTLFKTLYLTSHHSTGFSKAHCVASSATGDAAFIEAP